MQQFFPSCFPILPLRGQGSLTLESRQKTIPLPKNEALPAAAKSKTKAKAKAEAAPAAPEEQPEKPVRRSVQTRKGK